MKLLNQSEFEHLKIFYDNTIKYFPIITAVIEKIQKGYVIKEKNTFIVIHKFGFAYILGEECNYVSFIEKVKSKLVNNIPKIRLYDPQNRFEYCDSFKLNKSKRVKYLFSKKACSVDESDLIFVSKIDKEKLKTFSNLALDIRYWNNIEDFKANSLGIVNTNLNGICYAGSISNNYAEVDIFVQENVRKSGLATKLVKKFINECSIRQIKPLWDCYSNNLASVNLAEKTKFTKIFEYNYYNL